MDTAARVFVRVLVKTVGILVKTWKKWITAETERRRGTLFSSCHISKAFVFYYFNEKLAYSFSWRSSDCKAVPLVFYVSHSIFNSNSAVIMCKSPVLHLKLGAWSAVASVGWAQVWVNTAFDSSLTSIVALWSLVLNINDNAIYPNLFVDYLTRSLSLESMKCRTNGCCLCSDPL